MKIIIGYWIHNNCATKFENLYRQPNRLDRYLGEIVRWSMHCLCQICVFVHEQRVDTKASIVKIYFKVQIHPCTCKFTEICCWNKMVNEFIFVLQYRVLHAKTIARQNKALVTVKIILRWVTVGRLYQWSSVRK